MTNENLLPEKAPTTAVTVPAPGADRWFLSLLLPGLGQFGQRRFFVGAGQLGTVLAYMITALSLGSTRALVLAVVWNIWSAVDAYRHERD